MDGVTGALIGLGIPEFEAKRYEGRLQKGGILLSVHCDTTEEIKRAKKVLKASSGEDVSSAGEPSVDTKTTDHDVASKAARGNYESKWRKSIRDIILFLLKPMRVIELANGIGDARCQEAMYQ
jgi:hypothetical protein